MDHYQICRAESPSAKLINFLKYLKYIWNVKFYVLLLILPPAIRKHKQYCIKCISKCCLSRERRCPCFTTRNMSFPILLFRWYFIFLVAVKWWSSRKIVQPGHCFWCNFFVYSNSGRIIFWQSFDFSASGLSAKPYQTQCKKYYEFNHFKIEWNAI